jgi:hypothetical protein
MVPVSAQSAKALAPIDVTVDGIVTCDMPMHPLKDPEPIVKRPSLNDTDWIPANPSKALSDMALTVFGIAGSLPTRLDNAKIAVDFCLSKMMPEAYEYVSFSSSIENIPKLQSLKAESRLAATDELMTTSEMLVPIKASFPMELMLSHPSMLLMLVW